MKEYRIFNSTNLPKVIFITGVDGVGKTLFSNMLIKKLAKDGINAQYVWSRYNNYISKALLAFTRLTGHNYKEYHEGVVFGYHDFGNSKILSFLFKVFQIIDLNLVTYFKIHRRTMADKVLVCDRGPYDTIVDVMLDTGQDCLQEKLAKLLLLTLPEEHIVLYIYRPLEKIFENRPELKHDKSLPIKDKLYQLCNSYFSWEKLDNVDSPNVVFENILTRLYGNCNITH